MCAPVCVSDILYVMCMCQQMSLKRGGGMVGDGYTGLLKQELSF